MQGLHHLQRFEELSRRKWLGATRMRTRVTGSTNFDLAPLAALAYLDFLTAHRRTASSFLPSVPTLSGMQLLTLDT